MFEIFTKEVEIESVSGKMKLKLRPLSGRFLPKLYKILKVFQTDMGEDDRKTDISSQEFLKKLSEDVISDLHLISLETLKKSYPSANESDLDEFVSQNLMSLFPAIVEVNFNSKEK